MDKSGLLSYLSHQLTEILMDFSYLLLGKCILLLMKKIASIAIMAISISEEDYTLFGLIKAILLIILAQLMGSMCKFAFIFIRAISIFNKLFA